jgi:hypothetical protein
MLHREEEESDVAGGKEGDGWRGVEEEDGEEVEGALEVNGKGKKEEEDMRKR